MFSCVCVFFFFKQKTAYEMRISDWSSDVCSSDLATDRDGKMVTTQEALRIEEKILDLVKEGNGAANPVLSAADAPARLQAVAEHPLNPGQLAAADRTSVVSGKSVSVRVDLGGRRIIKKKKNKP